MDSGGVNLNETILMALIATIATWFLTALGSATVIFFKSPNTKILNLLLGFASGVMIAASFWSLLQPAIERAEQSLKLPSYIVVALGFMSGAIFMWITDKIVIYAQKRTNTNKSEINDRVSRIILLISSITIHNIPEGLAVGVAFGALRNNISTEGVIGAFTIAIGIGLQNFPEGAAVSLPLRREGYSRKSSFLLGQATALVEPIAGVLGAMLVVYIETMLPFALSFAAGAMILVAVHELIPECQKNQSEQPYFATMGIILGFTIMMVLDVMLG